MTQFRRLSAEEVQRMALRAKKTTVELTEYTDFLAPLSPGDWGELTLDADESQRTVKRRLTTAGKRLGKAVHYRRGEGRKIRFELR